MMNLYLVFVFSRSPCQLLCELKTEEETHVNNENRKLERYCRSEIFAKMFFLVKIRTFYILQRKTDQRSVFTIIFAKI